MNILIFGEIGRGKSSFINSFLCDNVDTTSSIPFYLLSASNYFYKIIYSEEKGAILTVKEHRTDSMLDKASNRVIRHIAKYGPKNVPSLIFNEREFYEELKHHQEAKIFEPDQCIYNNIDILTNNKLLKGISLYVFNSLYKSISFTNCEMELIQRSDAIIFLLDATRLCSASEMESIETLPSEKLFFVVNKMDYIRENERERLIEFANMKLSDKTSYAISYVSSFKALEAIAIKDINLYQESGMPFFISNFIMNINKLYNK